MPAASPADVRTELDTELSDTEIADILQTVRREIDRAYNGDPDYVDADHERDFEAALAALRIAQARDRRADTDELGPASVTYDASATAELTKRVRRRDPGAAFGDAVGVYRDTDRYVTSTDPNT